MHLKSTLELNMILDSERFNQLLNRVYSKSEYSDNDKFVDQTLVSKGILVTYHNKQYKKKVRLDVNLNLILDGDAPDESNADKLIRKLDKRISDYFGTACTLDDFNLSKMNLVTDIDVRSRANVANYIQVLKRIGRVKGFSLSRDDELGDDIGFFLNGNTNGLAFRIYDLESHLKEQLDGADSRRKRLKEMISKSAGLLRAEVQLVKSAAIRALTPELITSDQISDLCGKGRKVFLDVFQWVVPFGHFYKKDKALEIIRKEVTDMKLKYRMLRLVALVPEKKSLLLAQKALSYRRIDKVMEEFRNVEVSPVTISKRHDIKMLDNLFKYM
jgi:hypothetical protein